MGCEVRISSGHGPYCALALRIVMWLQYNSIPHAGVDEHRRFCPSSSFCFFFPVGAALGVRQYHRCSGFFVSRFRRNRAFLLPARGARPDAHLLCSVLPSVWGQSAGLPSVLSLSVQRVGNLLELPRIGHLEHTLFPRRAIPLPSRWRIIQEIPSLAYCRTNSDRGLRDLGHCAGSQSGQAQRYEQYQSARHARGHRSVRGRHQITQESSRAIEPRNPRSRGRVCRMVSVHPARKSCWT